MATVVVLGSGIAGHTAAAFARKQLGPQHRVVVVTPNAKYNWIPSNIWVGVGRMSPEEVTFELAPIYRKAGIEYHQANAVSLHPEGEAQNPQPYVTVEYTAGEKKGNVGNLFYDYLINATGPRLNFAATPGLGPDGYSHSVCTFGHAAGAAKAFAAAVEKMKRGELQKFLIGTGHGMATCQGAAFEYIFNVEFELRRLGVRDKAEIVWISNEYELGDFGMGGMHIKRGGYITNSKIFTESLFSERGLRWITRAHVQKVEAGRAFYETLDGGEKSETFDFAMLLPPFAGAGLKAYANNGDDITAKLFNPGGFMFVDADYSGKAYEEWKAADWPETYQSPHYKNIFAAGIAFAPPHPISKPMKSPKGTPIFPTPPRTGMPSAIIGRAVATTITNTINNATAAPEKASMARMGAACVASAGMGLLNGTAASMTVYPIVPDYEKYPGYGRDTDATFGEVGLAGHWIKHMLHHMFIYKAKLLPGWSLIPE